MLKKTALIGAVILAATISTGCSFTPTYYEQNSFAKNATNMGGSLSIKDRPAPEGGVNNFTQTVGFERLYIASGFAQGLVTGGLNLLNVAIDDGPRESRSSVFGWMPLSYADSREDAHRQLVAHVKQAIVRTLEHSDVEYTEIKSRDTGFVGYYIHDESVGCPSTVEQQKWHTDNIYYINSIKNPDACFVRATIHTPRIDPTPSAIVAKHTEKESYQLPVGNKSNFSTIQVASPQKSDLKENLLYTQISKNLPEWMYLYLAPKTVSLGQNGKIDFPYILNQGEASFFVHPE